MSRGENGERLYEEAIVLRMWSANLWKSQQIEGCGSGALAIAFELSTTDEKAPIPHLSVFDESITTPHQACQLTGGAKDLALRLPVCSIRGLTYPEYNQHRLDVCWFIAWLYSNDQWNKDDRPGSEGHCGIIGLLRPPGMPKIIWKWFRVRLADIALENQPILLS